MPRATPTPTRVRGDDTCLQPHAAGLASGASAIVVAVPPARDAEPVRVCETFTPDLHARVDWLVTGPSDTVVMASIGVYGVPIFARREPHGITPLSSTRGRSRPCRDARRTGTMPRGASSSTHWVDGQGRVARLLRGVSGARSCGIARR
jgi:hypothetical protein